LLIKNTRVCFKSNLQAEGGKKKNLKGGTEDDKRGEATGGRSLRSREDIRLFLLSEKEMDYFDEGTGLGHRGAAASDKKGF